MTEVILASVALAELQQIIAQAQQLQQTIQLQTAFQPGDALISVPLFQWNFKYPVFCPAFQPQQQQQHQHQFAQHPLFFGQSFGPVYSTVAAPPPPPPTGQFTCELISDPSNTNVHTVIVR